MTSPDGSSAARARSESSRAPAFASRRCCPSARSGFYGICLDRGRVRAAARAAAAGTLLPGGGLPPPGGNGARLRPPGLRRGATVSGGARHVRRRRMRRSRRPDRRAGRGRCPRRRGDCGQRHRHGRRRAAGALGLPRVAQRGALQPGRAAQDGRHGAARRRPLVRARRARGGGRRTGPTRRCSSTGTSATATST